MKILNIEMKNTAKGAPYKSCELDQEIQGKRYFNVFSFHPRYEDIQIGLEIDAVDFQYDGKFINLIDPNKGIKTAYRATGGATRGIPAAQERKAEYIEKAQDKKEESIAFFNATNSAIAILTKIKPPVTDDSEFKQELVMWRDWFYQEWQKHNRKENPKSPVDMDNEPF